MTFNRKQLLLYAVTDRSWVGRQTLLEQIEDALSGGVTIVQLREKMLSVNDFIREAIEVKNLCRRHGVPLIINDNVEVALKSGADGVHVGTEDARVADIRKSVGNDFIIGATAKSIDQAITAEKEGANYIGVGAVFPSPTKTNAIRITIEQLREICSSVSIPAVAIGGIDLDNAEKIKGCDIAGIAVVSAIFASGSISESANKLKNMAKMVAMT